MLLEHTCASISYTLSIVGHDFCISLQVKNILKEGGGVREFYLNELVTHVITESPPDPATLPLSDVVVVKVGGLSC